MEKKNLQAVMRNDAKPQSDMSDLYKVILSSELFSDPHTVRSVWGLVANMSWLPAVISQTTGLRFKME